MSINDQETPPQRGVFFVRHLAPGTRRIVEKCRGMRWSESSFKQSGNVRFGSLAALQANTILTSAFGGKADVEAICLLCMIIRFPRYPAANMLAVLPKLVAILVSKPIFLVPNNKHVGDDKTKTSVRQQIRRPKEPRFRK